MMTTSQAAGTDSARDRYLQTMAFQPASPPFLVAGWIWNETDERWRTEGWDGTPLATYFGTDAYCDVAPDHGPCPPFTYQLVAEDEVSRTFVDHDGILMREFVHHRDQSMPQFLRFPVESAADFDRLALERFGAKLPDRLNAAWCNQVAAAAGSNLPRRCWPGRWGGFFGPLRNLMGLENLCLAFYDQPLLIERMMAQRADQMIAIAAGVLQHTALETYWFWEDMAFNHGSLIRPDLFRRFALPHYRRVVDFLHSRGVRHIGLDSDGDIRELLPLWLDAGIDFLWPFEVAAGMDVLAVRREYGHDLALGGGIGKAAVAAGGATMRREVDRVMPLVDDGGYLPELDHGAPPDISWAAFVDYLTYLRERLGRG